MTVKSEWTAAQRNYPKGWALKWRNKPAIGEQSATWQEFSFYITATRTSRRQPVANSLGLDEMRDCPIRMDGFRAADGNAVQFASDWFPSIESAKGAASGWLRREDMRQHVAAIGIGA